MNHFSNILKKHYSLKGKRVVFSNGLSPAKLAILMWEELNFSEVDGSVLSRVLAGERLFTPKQLEVFSRILHLSDMQREELYSALMKDYLERKNPKDNHSLVAQLSTCTISVSTSELLELCKKLFIEGKYHELNDLASTMLKNNDFSQGRSMCGASHIRDDFFNHITKILFYVGITSGMTNGREVVCQSEQINQQLKEIAVITNDPMHWALYHLICANKHYVTAEYLLTNDRSRIPPLTLMLKHALSAVKHSKDEDMLYLFALRYCVIGYSRLQQREELDALYQHMLSCSSAMSEEYDIFALRFFKSAFYERRNLGFDLDQRSEEMVKTRYKDCLSKTVFYKISDIRTQIVSTQITEDAEKLVEMGCELTQMHRYLRHYESIKKYKEKLSA